MAKVEFDERLLTPGWGGFLADDEVAYIRHELKVRPRLKTRWGFSRGAKRLSAAKIRARADGGQQNAGPEPKKAIFQLQNKNERPPTCVVLQPEQLSLFAKPVDAGAGA